MAILPDWYSYGAINFTGYQIRWILENLTMLEEGKWPPEGVETGYTGASSSQLRAEGTQVKPTLIAAEVTLRLRQCGDDGHDTIGYYQGRVDIEWLAQHDHSSQQVVWRRIWRSIRYSTGPCRRWMPCSRCRRVCLHMDRRAENYQEWKLRDRKGLKATAHTS